MTTDQRIKALLDATPEKIDALDSILLGSAQSKEPALRLYRMGEACAVLGISRTTLWRAIQENRIEVVEIRKGSHRIPEAELRRFAGAA
jgi:excisionase family DNA binding protein